MSRKGFSQGAWVHVASHKGMDTTIPDLDGQFVKMTRRGMAEVIVNPDDIGPGLGRGRGSTLIVPLSVLSPER